MHRHSYQGRKLSRDTDQRRALIRGQVTSLVLHEQLLTTQAKAKEIAPAFERIVTQAKKGDLHHQRQMRTFLLTENAVQKMIQELAPAFAKRDGGYTRIIKAGFRRGDNAPMAVVSLVLPVKKKAEEDQATVEAETKATKTKATVAAPEVASAKPTKKAKPKTAVKAGPARSRRGTRNA